MSARRIPPREHQFKKGVSGNPAGRPKPVTPLLEDAHAILGAPVVSQTSKGVLRQAPLKAMVRRLFQRALAGDVRLLKTALGLARIQEEVVANDIESHRRDAEAAVDKMIKMRFLAPQYRESMIASFLKPYTPEGIAANEKLRHRAIALMRKRDRAGEPDPCLTEL